MSMSNSNYNTEHNNISRVDGKNVFQESSNIITDMKNLNISIKKRCEYCKKEFNYDAKRVNANYVYDRLSQCLKEFYFCTGNCLLLYDNNTNKI